MIYDVSFSRYMPHRVQSVYRQHIVLVETSLIVFCI